MGKNGQQPRRVLDYNALLQRYTERIAVMYRQPTVRAANLLAQGVAEAGLMRQAKGLGNVQVSIEPEDGELVVQVVARITITDPTED